MGINGSKHNTQNQNASSEISAFWGVPERPCLEGVMTPPLGPVFSNSKTPALIENEFCKGTCLALHRTTYDKALDKAGHTENHGNYFAGKKRIWEQRFQFTFKKPPISTDLFVGIELEQYVPLGMAEVRSQKVMVEMLKRVVNKAYHSPGDDPKKVSGPLERPTFVMPLWAFDQYIVTPKGEDPPSLSDHTIESLGSKRAGRIKAFRKEVDALEFEVGQTYTFCFWGISRFLDQLKWELRGIPLITPLDFNKFCGRPPVHLVLFTLNNTADEHEKRFLQSRKNYYFDLAFWSSEKRPSWEHVRPLIGDLQEHMNSKLGTSHDNQISTQMLRKQRQWLSCCVSR